jgi:hypothetical protein
MENRGEGSRLHRVCIVCETRSHAWRGIHLAIVVTVEGPVLKDQKNNNNEDVPSEWEAVLCDQGQLLTSVF